jgi:hypothetical protein
VAVFFIDLLGHWALRLFAVGFTVGSVLAGGAAAVLVARAAPAAGAGGLAGRGAAGAGRPGRLPGPAGSAVAARVRGGGGRGGVAYVSVLPAPSAAWSATRSRPGRGLGRTRRELLRAAVGAAGLLATGFVVRRLTGGIGDAGGRPLARPAGAGPLRPPPARRPATTPAPGSIAGLTAEVTPNRLHYTVDESIIDPNIDSRLLAAAGRRPGRPAGDLGYDDLLAMRPPSST